MNILVTVKADAKHRGRLEAAIPGGVFAYTAPDKVTDGELRAADVILGNLDRPQRVRVAEKLRWIQLNSAGTEGYCEPGVLPEGAVLTNATGAYGPGISEYMVGALFMLRKKLNLYYANQLRGEWKPEGAVGAVENNRVLVIGLGDVGGSFGAKMKALGCHVTGVKRRFLEKPDFVDELYLIEELDHILPKADVVALCLPGNGDTYHLLDERRIGLLSHHAVVINVGRGAVLDTEALYQALLNKRIKGAYLDVTDPEPLPPSHPLWNLDNVVITPHITGGFWMPETLERIFDIMVDNLLRFVKGETLVNRVDMVKGYRI